MCTRRFLGVVERDCENPNSGVVQVVKGDSSNAWELFAHLPLIRTHLGKGLSSNVTLKEMYLGNRRLLGTLKGADVEHFMQLLLQDRNPQYIDFLLSICICDDEPLPSNQELVCEQLLNLNAHLLPTCQVEAARESGELAPGHPSARRQGPAWPRLLDRCVQVYGDARVASRRGRARPSQPDNGDGVW